LIDPFAVDKFQLLFLSNRTISIRVSSHYIGSSLDRKKKHKNRTKPIQII